MLVLKAACTLTRTGQVETGVHVFEVMLEDFPTTNITLTYANGTTERRDRSSAPLCRVKLQFSVEGEKSSSTQKKPKQRFRGGAEPALACFLVSQSFLRS